MATVGEAGDDAGSMPVVMLLAMVGMGLSVVLASITATQTVISRRVAQRPPALDAAQAGLDVAIARIRAAVNATGAGDRTLLPCGPYNGAVGGIPASTYHVSIVYRTIGGTAISCSGAGAASTPATADLTSSGTDNASGIGRTVTATYHFWTTNLNIQGGLVHVYHDTTDPTAADLCLDAGSATPAAGTPLWSATCRPGSAQQTFAYGDQLDLYLVSSITDTQPLGMCLDGGAVPRPTTATSSFPLTFQPCTATVAAREQWSVDDHSNLEGTSDGVSTDLWCFAVSTPGTSSPILLYRNNRTKPDGETAYCKGNSSMGHTMRLDATVGAGAAVKAGSPQVVNFAQFGRCIDVVNKDPANPYLQVYTCKQSPSASLIAWNQIWAVPTVTTGQSSIVGQLKTTDTDLTPSVTYCLSSPLTTTAGSYPVLAVCPSGTPASGAATTWTINGATNTYATSYTMVDSAGNCLAATDPNAPNPDLTVGTQSFSKVIVTACTGSTLQKWNAPPGIVFPQVRDLHEK